MLSISTTRDFDLLATSCQILSDPLNMLAADVTP